MPATTPDIDDLVQAVERPDGQIAVRHTITLTPSVQMHADYSPQAARALAHELVQAADEAQLLG